MARFEKEKQETYEYVKNKYKNIDVSYEKKLKRFNKMWDRAEEIARYFYFETSTNKNMGEIVSDLVSEFYERKNRGSILEVYRDVKSRSFEENVMRATKLRVKGRLKEFLDDFGEETYEYNGKERTLNQWVNQYLKGNISSQELFNIIDFWKDGNEPYMLEFYRKNDIDADIIEQQKFSGNLY